VDSDGGDIATFFHYLGHAARRISGGPLPAFDACYTGNVAGFSRHFFRQLFSRLTAPAALELDALPALSCDSALHTVVEAGLAQVPRRCCIIVTSRGEAPATLARMRASGELVCLGADEQTVLEPPWPLSKPWICGAATAPSSTICVACLTPSTAMRLWTNGS
jgi:ATP/maltotriose-dependent transcriptional regulator MalT